MVILLAWEESPRTKSLIETCVERSQFVTNVTPGEQSRCAPLSHGFGPVATLLQPIASSRANRRHLPSVKQRDGRIPFDGVPDRWGKLIALFVGLRFRVSAAAVVDADDRSIRD